MFVDKIGIGLTKQIGFKGYNHEVNDYGSQVLRFNFPIDYDAKKAWVEIYKVKRSRDAYCGYVVDDKDNPIASYELKKDGTVVDVSDLDDLEDGAPFAYRIMVDGKKVNETGIGIENGAYTLVTQKGTTPMSDSAGILIMPDILPRLLKDPDGYKLADINRQKDAEEGKRTYGNVYGGNLAAVEAFANANKVNTVAVTPMTSGSNRTSHLYDARNNFQISERLGTVDDFDSFIINLFKNGQKYMLDAPFTSEGLEGIHLQYAMKWASKGYMPDELFMFNMESIKDGPLTLGVVPMHKDNFRVRFVNAPDIIEQSGDKVVSKKNPSYNPNKPTYVQCYDNRFVSDEQLAKDEVIDAYDKLQIDDKMGVNTYKDTAVPYAFEIYDWKSILSNIDAVNKEGLSLDSADGAIAISKLPYLKFGHNTDGIMTWDANNDLAKLLKSMSDYVEKQLKRIPDESVRNYMRARYKRAVNQNNDMDNQVLAYWAERIKNTQTLYGAQVLKGAKTVADIQHLIDEGKLPAQAAKLTESQIEKILKGTYKQSLSLEDKKDDATLKALMKLPLVSLEVGENTQMVLATPYFTNKAATDEQIGKTRFELDKECNPQFNKLCGNDVISAEQEAVYRKVNNLFKVDILNFANEVIAELDKTSDEKLLDGNGEYTTYGRYVINVYGMQIAKYAFLKAMAGDKFSPKVLEDGSIVYNYDEIKENTYLEALGVKSNSPEAEASSLLHKISSGLSKLNLSDVKTLAQAFGKQLAGTTAQDFKMADALYNVMGLGMDLRLDAVKDNVNMDEVRNGAMSFEEAWKQLAKMLGYIVTTIKEFNPNANIMAELTDLYQLMSANYGEGFGYDEIKNIGHAYKNIDDAVLQFFNETGITTEAGYSFFFTNLLNVFSREFTNAAKQEDAINVLRNTLRTLINTRDVDYIRNMINFIDNQDKPRPIQYMAIDLPLFYGEVIPLDKNNNYNHELNKDNRELAMKIIAGVEELKDMPLELRLNIDNIDYVRTISNRAVAMSKLLKESMDGIDIPADVRKYMIKALADLTEGRYLDYVQSNRAVIDSSKLPELQSMDAAFDAVLARTNLSNDKKTFIKNSLLERANSDALIYKHLVVGQITDEGNMNRLKNVTGEDITPENAEKYSLYTVCIASIIKEVADGIAPELKEELYKGIKAFVKEFDEAKVKEGSLKSNHSDSSELANRKKGYASNQIEYNIARLFEQAEYLARKDNKLSENEHFADTDKIMEKMFRNATEPAVQKYLRTMAVLSALPGIPIFFSGDEIGLTGGEEKAKNLFLQNRNAYKILDLLNGTYKEYRQRIAEKTEEIMLIRKRLGIDPLNNGTPYMLNCADNRVITYMMQNANGDVVVPIINMSGVDQETTANYYSGKDEKNSINKDNVHVPGMDAIELDCIELPDGLSLKEGTELRNTDTTDEQVYKVVKQNGKYYIRRENRGFGNKIVLNQDTAKYGVLILTTVAAAAAGMMYKKGVKPGNLIKTLSNIKGAKPERPLVGALPQI